MYPVAQLGAIESRSKSSPNIPYLTPCLTKDRSDPDQETEEWETRSKEEQNVLEEARRRLEARFGVGRQGSRGRKFSHEDSPIYNGEDNQV